MATRLGQPAGRRAVHAEPAASVLLVAMGARSVGLGGSRDAACPAAAPGCGHGALPSAGVRRGMWVGANALLY